MKVRVPTGEMGVFALVMGVITLLNGETFWSLCILVYAVWAFGRQPRL